MHDAPARQVDREFPARLGPREALHRDAGRLGLLGYILAGRRGEFLQLQFQLIERALAALRARAKQLALGSIRTGAGLKYGQYPRGGAGTYGPAPRSLHTAMQRRLAGHYCSVRELSLRRPSAEAQVPDVSEAFSCQVWTRQRVIITVPRY